MPKRAVIYLLLDDWEDDLIELACIFAPAKRKRAKAIFVNRRKERAFSILVERYLFTDHELFTDYLRVTPRVFYIILKYVSKDIYVAPYNRVPNPIDPSQKLCIALRY